MSKYSPSLLSIWDVCLQAAEAMQVEESSFGEWSDDIVKSAIQSVELPEGDNGGAHKDGHTLIAKDTNLLS